MPYTVPHTFPTLRGSNGPLRPSLLLMGAGMSYGIAPLPRALLAESGVSASTLMGCPQPVAADTLYTWADRAVKYLISIGDPNPKLKLGTSLGLTSDARWLGFSAAERSRPEHRVIARFSREGLWEQIWSFNWDCVQESALENVGITRNGEDPRLPWPAGFRTFITADECPQVAEANMVHLIKPHGCVHALAEAERQGVGGNLPRALELASRFLITKTELDALDPSIGPVQTFIFATLCSRLSGHPLVTVGWSASERYLLDHIDNTVRPLLAARSLGIDELSIIDIAFHEGHPRLAQCYNKTQAEAHVPVGVPAFSTGALFLWIQALYGLERLRLVLNGQARVGDVQAIQQIETQLVLPPDHGHFAIDWIDNFLSVWVRLCWRCGLIEYYDRQNHLIQAEEFNLERRDEHIPWNLTGCARHDLIAAGIFMAAIQRNGSAVRWDFSSFPGGMYNPADSHLVVPLPAWQTGSDNELRGLHPLLKALQAGGMLAVQRMSVLPLMTNDAAAGPSMIAILKESLARRIGMAAFATSDKISVVDLAGL